jgi:hypothetical protein
MWKVVPLKKGNEEQFLDALRKDEILHIFTIYDLKHARGKTQVWMVLRNDKLRGYLFEYDNRIVHTHGTAGSIEKLLGYVKLDELVLVIEPHHLSAIKRTFNPVEPTDAASKGVITKYLIMKLNPDNFKPLIHHRVKRLGKEDTGEAGRSLGEEYAKRVEGTVQNGMVYGAYEDRTLASVAMVPEITDRIAFIRGVLTVASLRNRGLATSAVSALTEEIISMGKEAVLWVAEDNFPARRVYERMGFESTKYSLLGFKARRL